MATRVFNKNKKNKKPLQINPASVLPNTWGDLKSKPVLFSARANANS